MAGNKGADDEDPPLNPDDQLFADELERQLIERRRRPVALFEATRFRAESAARQFAYVKIVAHRQVKEALLMAERLRFLALTADAILSRYGDPTKAKDRAVELSLAPYFRELAELCAPFVGTQEIQRDRLIELLERSAEAFSKTRHKKKDWDHALWALREALMGMMPGVAVRLTNDDLRRGISVWLPERLRPDLDDLPGRWEQLTLLAEKADLGVVAKDTVRVQYTRHKSAKANREKAEREELSRQPVGTGKLDGLSGPERERAEEQIRAIEARALTKLWHPSRRKP